MTGWSSFRNAIRMIAGNGGGGSGYHHVIEPRILSLAKFVDFEQDLTRAEVEVGDTMPTCTLMTSPDVKDAVKTVN